jgi:hypothetical protein
MRRLADPCRDCLPFSKKATVRFFLLHGCRFDLADLSNGKAYWPMPQGRLAAAFGALTKPLSALQGRREMPRTPFLVSFALAFHVAGLASAQPAVLPRSALPAQPVPATAPASIAPTVPAPVLPAQPTTAVNCCPSCAEENRWTVEADYLLWWLKAAPTPPLLTTSTNPADFAAIGNPTTTILFGGKDTDFSQDSGLRMFATYRLNENWGLQVGGFLMEEQARSVSIRSDINGNPTIGIPFLSAFDNSEQANIIAAPGPPPSVGSATARIDNRLWGLEANASAQLVDNETWRLNALGGFRFVSLREEIRLDTESGLVQQPGLFVGNVVNPNTIFTSFDEFATRNSFYGAQLGADTEWRLGMFFVDAFANVGLGVTHERSSVKGGTTALDDVGNVLTAPGGTLALTTNSVKTTSDRFTVLPEVGVNIGVHLNQHVTLSGGYSFLYWSDVVRPGDQVDRRVNPNFIPTQDNGTHLGPALPATQFNHTDFWAQGLNLSLMLGW